MAWCSFKIGKLLAEKIYPRSSSRYLGNIQQILFQTKEMQNSFSEGEVVGYVPEFKNNVKSLTTACLDNKNCIGILFFN